MDSRSSPSAWSAISAPMRRQEISSSSLMTRSCSTAPARPAGCSPRATQRVGARRAAGEVLFLAGGGAGGLPRREVGRRDGRVAGGAGEGVDPQGLVGTAVHAVVPRTGAEQDVLTCAEQEDGAAGGGAREVADIGGAGDQRGGAAAGFTAGPELRSAGDVHL